MTNRIFCVYDQILFEKVGTGKTVKLNKNARIRGDLYECPVCHFKVYGDFGEPY